MSKTVLEMAQSVGAVDQDLLDRHTEYVVFTKSQLEAFAELVRADDIAAIEGLERSSIWITREEAIAAIRARGSRT